MRQQTTPRTPRRVAALLAVPAVLAAAAGLTGCASQDGVYAHAATGKDAVAIGVDATSPEQVVLGEIYSRVLQQLGRPTSVTALDNGVNAGADALPVLQETQVDFVVACTGTLVEANDPAAAAALRKEHDADPDDAGFSDRVYDAAVATLPGNVQTVDPSPSQGCGAGDLPNNVIPVFRKGVFDRTEVNRLNFITRVLASSALEKMTKEYAAGGELTDVLAAWMIEYAHIDVHAGELADPAGAADPDSATGGSGK